MTDTTRPSGGASSELRRTIWPWSTEIPLLSADPFNLDARLVIDNEEYVRCTGRDGYTLTGCERGLSPEDGGSEAKLWRGGTPVDQVPWTTTEVVTDYPDTPTLAMVGRDFAWDAGDGNIYRYHVVLIEDAPVVIWDDEPPAGATDLTFTWASQITGLTGISGVALDASGNIFVAFNIPGFSNDRLQKYSSALALQWDKQTVDLDVRHLAVDASSIFITNPTLAQVMKRTPAAGNIGSPASFGTLGSGDGQFSSGGPVGIAFDGTNVWVTDPVYSRAQKFTAATGAYVSKFGTTAGPTGIALGPTSTHLYILVAGAGTIRKYLKSDHSLVATFTLGNGTADGQISTTAEGIAVDSTGRIWIADTGNHRIQVYDSAGLFLGKIGSFGSGDSQFKSPKQLAVGAGDIISVADSGNNRLVTVAADTSGGSGTGYTVGPYIQFLLRPDNGVGAATAEWTNMPLASTELFGLGSPAHRRLADLTDITECLFNVYVHSAGFAGSVLNLEYTTDLTGATGWASLGTSTLSLAATGWVNSGWDAIAVGANAVVLLRVMGSGGNGGSDPQFLSIAAQFRGVGVEGPAGATGATGAAGANGIVSAIADTGSIDLINTAGTLTAKTLEHFNVKDYGAVGDGASHPLSGYYANLAAAQVVYPRATALSEEIDRHAIQHAIDEAGSWNTVYVPGGKYRIDSTLQIGGTAVPGEVSDTQGIALIGEGMGYSSDESDEPPRGGSTLEWWGAAGGTLLLVEGPINAVRVEGFYLQGYPPGGNQVDYPFIINHAAESTFKRITIVDYGAVGLYLHAYPSPTGFANGCNQNHFEQIVTGGSGTATDAIALQVGNDDVGADPKLDVALNTFINCRFRTPLSANNIGVLLANCDNNTFIHCYFQGGATGGGIQRLSPTGGPHLPGGNRFFGCEFRGGETGDTPSGGLDIVFPAIMGDGGVMPQNNTIGMDSDGNLAITHLGVDEGTDDFVSVFDIDEDPHRVDVRDGTAAAPVGTGSTIHASRVQEVTRADIDAISAGTDGSMFLAAIAGQAEGTVDDKGQPIGVFGSATTSSNAAPGTAGTGNDATAVYGVGRVLTGGTGMGAGGFFLGRNESASGRTCGIEVHTQELGQAHVYEPAGYSEGVGIWLTTLGDYDNAAAIVLGKSTAAGRYLYGLAIPGIVGGGSTGAIKNASFRDDGEATTVFDVNGTHTTVLDTVGATVSGNAILLAASHIIGWNGRSEITSPADSRILLTNDAGTDFSRIMFGGTTSSFPAIRRTGTELQAILADASDSTLFRAKFLAISGNSAQSGDIRLVNDGWVTARNAANSADINVLKVNASNAIELGSDLAVTEGGTGASTAAGARTNLGLDAGSAGDIWVEKAGDTMTGSLIASMGTVADIPFTARSGSNSFVGERYSADTTAANFVMRKSRHATVGSHTIVQSGDVLCQLVGQGSDGSGFVTGGSVRVEVDGTPGATDMPGRIILATTPDAGSAAVERVRVDALGGITHTSVAGGAVVFNEGGVDTDTRIEGDTDANLVFVDASTDRVGIGKNNPAVKLDVTGAINATGALTLGTDLAITEGGTGQSTAVAAFNALSPLTTQGDLLTRDGTNNIRLAKGTSLQKLRMNVGATDVEWGDGDDLVGRFRLPADAGAGIGATIANFFGTNSAFSTAASTIYYVVADCYFTKTTAGTVVWTLTSSVNLTAGSLGFTPPGVLTGNAGSSAGAATVVTLASGSLTTAVKHYMQVTGLIETNTAGNIRLNVTQSAGTLTPLRGSMYRVYRVTSANIGSFVA